MDIPTDRAGIENLLARTSSDSKPRIFNEAELKIVGGLFVRISIVYGHLWMSQFKTERMIEIAKRE